jgi:hypothetical protein
MRWLPIILLLCAGACESKRSSSSQGSSPAPGPGTAPKTADDCELFFKKARPTLRRMAQANSMVMTQSIEEQGIRDCREDQARGVRSQLIDCVLAARDEQAVEACFPRIDELALPAGSGSANGSAQ